MKYKKLLDEDLVAKHATAPQEIKELLGVVTRDLQDARLTGLSDDRAFATA